MQYLYVFTVRCIFRSNKECGAVSGTCVERTIRKVASVGNILVSYVAYTVHYLVAHVYAVYGKPRLVVMCVG
jgi:hypothetical protein